MRLAASCLIRILRNTAWQNDWQKLGSTFRQHRVQWEKNEIVKLWVVKIENAFSLTSFLENVLNPPPRRAQQVYSRINLNQSRQGNSTTTALHCASSGVNYVPYSLLSLSSFSASPSGAGRTCNDLRLLERVSFAIRTLQLTCGLHMMPSIRFSAGINNKPINTENVLLYLYIIKISKKQILPAANTNLLNSLFPKAQNREC